MSGKQAKAKRKSAKKADGKDIWRKGGRLDQVVVANVRCFANEQSIPIRPVTLLVGENSTGKTTFLGCYRVLLDMLSHAPRQVSEDQSLMFNIPPFAMGGIRDIARKTPGKANPAGEFHLGGTITDPDSAASPLSLTYTFREGDAGVTAVNLAFLFSDGAKMRIVKGSASGRNGWLGAPVKIIGPGFCYESAVHKGMLDMVDLLNLLPSALHGDMPSRKGKDIKQERERKKFAEFLSLAPLHQIEDATLRRALARSSADAAPANTDKKSAVFKRDIEGITTLLSFSSCVPFAPIRSKPRRNYDPILDDPEVEGGRVPAEISKMARVNPKKWRELRRRLAEFGRSSGMFTDLHAKSHSQKAGSPFEILVNATGTKVNILDVGYGVSQIYPLLAQIMRDRNFPRRHFLLQQPEVHLHPRAQAALGTLFVEMSKELGQYFLVETHSDFVVDRVCTHVAKGEIAPDDVSLLYFEKQKTGGAVKIHRIELNGNGEPISTPKGYREFFQHETERVLGFRKD